MSLRIFASTVTFSSGSSLVANRISAYGYLTSAERASLARLGASLAVLGVIVVAEHAHLVALVDASLTHH